MGEIKRESELIPGNLKENNETTVTAEMPDDFAEPEGKSGKWSEVIEDTELGIRYHEKVIELSKHRQNETGIERIRRRELLPPFPAGLLSKSGDSIVWHGDKKFDDIYNFLTDNNYPSKGSIVHTMSWTNTTANALPSDSHKREELKTQTNKFIKDSLYFQEISGLGHMYFNKDRMYTYDFNTPVFMFGSKNHILINYFDYLANNYIAPSGVLTGNTDFVRARYKDMLDSFKNRKFETPNEDFSTETFYYPKYSRGVKPLRWCHAELALIPTKRSLNVLFFEAKDKNTNKQ